MVISLIEVKSKFRQKRYSPSLNKIFRSQRPGARRDGGRWVPQNCLSRLNADSSLDASFATADVEADAYPAAVLGVAFQPDSKIILGGFFDTAAAPPCATWITPLSPAN